MKKAVLITFLMAIIVSCKSSENKKTEKLENIISELLQRVEALEAKTM